MNPFYHVEICVSFQSFVLAKIFKFFEGLVLSIT